MVDDELDRFGVRTTVDELVKDERMRRTWDRYHLIGEAMRGQHVRGCDEAFIARIQEQIKQSAAEAEARAAPGWLRPVSGLAIAASVAAVALFGLRSVQGPELGGAQMAQEGDQAVIARNAEPLPPIAPPQLAGQWSPVDHDDVIRLSPGLNSYLVSHTEHAATSTPVPYPRVRIVGFSRAE
jgi:sigma-E factor negative regulatory protein RseA